MNNKAFIEFGFRKYKEFCRSRGELSTSICSIPHILLNLVQELLNMVLCHCIHTTGPYLNMATDYVPQKVTRIT